MRKRGGFLSGCERTWNRREKTVQGSMFKVQGSMFNVQGSMLSAHRPFRGFGGRSQGIGILVTQSSNCVPGRQDFAFFLFLVPARPGCGQANSPPPIFFYYSRTPPLASFLRGMDINNVQTPINGSGRNTSFSRLPALEFSETSGYCVWKRSD